MAAFCSGCSLTYCSTARASDSQGRTLAPGGMGSVPTNGLFSSIEIEARSVNPQVAFATRYRAGSRLEASDWYRVRRFGVALPPVDAFQVAAGLHQFANELLLASGSNPPSGTAFGRAGISPGVAQVSRDFQVRRRAAPRRRTRHYPCFFVAPRRKSLSGE